MVGLSRRSSLVASSRQGRSEGSEIVRVDPTSQTEEDRDAAGCSRACRRASKAPPPPPPPETPSGNVKRALHGGAAHAASAPSASAPPQGDIVSLATDGTDGLSRSLSTTRVRMTAARRRDQGARDRRRDRDGEGAPQDESSSTAKASLERRCTVRIGVHV